MNISIDLVKQLRDETGISIAKCKEALEQASGDIDAAKEILKEFSAGQSAKKADRELAAGTIASYIHTNKTIGTMIKLECETDFVAINPEFIQLASQIAMHATAMGSTLETINEEIFIHDGERTIHSVIESAMQKLGERIEITDLVRMSIGK
jgi:elongation factor Ts